MDDVVFRGAQADLLAILQLRVVAAVGPELPEDIPAMALVEVTRLVDPRAKLEIG